MGRWFDTWPGTAAINSRLRGAGYKITAFQVIGLSLALGVAAIAIGVNGNRSQLQEEVRRVRPEFPAYEASPDLIRSMGGVPATPFTLLGDANGEFVNWTRGYVKPSELRSFVDSHEPLRCTRND